METAREKFVGLVLKVEDRLRVRGDEAGLRNLDVFKRAAIHPDESLAASALDKLLLFVPEGSDPEMVAAARAWCAEAGMKPRRRH